MWPLVLDKDPLREDKRTEQESVAVMRGRRTRQTCGYTRGTLILSSGSALEVLREYHPAEREQPWSAPL